MENSRLHIRISKELKKQLSLLAKSRGQSVGELVRNLIEKELDDE